MTLSKNQYVTFPNGEKHGYLEARWSEKSQAFYTFAENEDGETIKLYSVNVSTKEPKPHKAAFIPAATNCTVEIFPHGETEKAYQIEDGTNGKITRGNYKAFYKYIAKSVCYVDVNGKIYAPIWA